LFHVGCTEILVGTAPEGSLASVASMIGRGETRSELYTSAGLPPIDVLGLRSKSSGWMTRKPPVPGRITSGPNERATLCSGSTPRICEEVAQPLTTVVCVLLVPTLPAWSNTRASSLYVPAERGGEMVIVALPLAR